MLGRNQWGSQDVSQLGRLGRRAASLANPHPCRLAARMPSQAGSLTSYFGCSRSKWFVSASSLVIASGSVAS